MEPNKRGLAWLRVTVLGSWSRGPGLSLTGSSDSGETQEIYGYVSGRCEIVEILFKAGYHVFQSNKLVTTS